MRAQRSRDDDTPPQSGVNAESDESAPRSEPESAATESKAMAVPDQVAGEAAAPRAEAPSVEDGEAPPPSITYPQVREASEARYPLEAANESGETRVELFVTVRANGSVGKVAVAQSGGEEFDRAAIEAVRAWRFEPAKRDGTPMAATIRVPFLFTMPSVPLTTVTPQPGDEAGATEEEAEESDVASEEPAVEEPPEVTVRGKRELREEARSSGDFTFDHEHLALAPRSEGAEVLRTAPGVFIARPGGPAVAHSYMLRGFDADHGQDIEFRVGGLPINLPAHIHGQGYADLGFLIGDTVQQMDVSEGVYDPRQGDFAVAGSIDLSLGMGSESRGLTLRSAYGSFNTFRQQAYWAPRSAPDETFGAVEYVTTDGFGENRAGQSVNAILQNRFGEGAWTYRALGILHTARSDIAGVLRLDDIESGEVCWACVYPYATAEGQDAAASRFMAGLFADYIGQEGDNGQVGFWLGYDDFRSQQNFTGFLERSRTLERVGGRGDLIEQQNRTLSFGLTGRYRSQHVHPAEWAHGTVEVGVDGRLDVIEQSQNLIDASVRNQTWDERVDASVRAVDVGMWADMEWMFTRFVEWRAGLRADALSYGIEDRLGNFAPSVRPQDTYIVGFRRSAQGLALGPRTSLEVRPLHWLKLQAAYGEGFRSPQARTLEDGERAPFTKVRSGDIGVQFDWGDLLRLTLGGYATQLSDDVAFSASEGRLERIGATRRLGGVAYAETHPWDWLLGTLSVTYVDATLLEPPPPTADEPEPPFSEGQSLPFVPPVVVRADVGAKRQLANDVAGQHLTGKLGLGYSFLSPRPLPYGDAAASVSLLDASAGLDWGPLELSFEMFNLLDAEYAAREYSHPSDWDPNDGVRSRTPARHIAAGAPRSWMLSLGGTL